MITEVWLFHRASYKVTNVFDSNPVFRKQKVMHHRMNISIEPLIISVATEESVPLRKREKL